MPETIMVPLHLLSITNTNARKDHVADKAMIASLQSQGLLYPLLVKGITGSESYDVVDGARRLTCILKGMEDGTFLVSDWETVPCILSNGLAPTSGLEQSLHANLHTAMHPLDECEAILRLAEDEDDKAAIALRFGKDTAWLEQRVKLAGLDETVKQAFRDGQIGLGEAMDFTLGDAKRQRVFLKAYLKKELHRSAIRQEMTGKAVRADHINFDLADYPADKIQRDLFSEEVYLLDRKLVLELQDLWVQGEIERLKQLGYDEVKALAQDDWQTLNSHVQVTGRISAEARSKLKCFLKMDHNGYVNVYEGYASRKAVEKAAVKKDKHAVDSVDGEEAVKPLVCTDLSPAQHEIINALAAADLYREVIKGNKLLADFLVVDRVFGSGTWTEGNDAFKHNGTVNRWERLAKDYPNEQLINISETEQVGLDDQKSFDFAAWKALSPTRRGDIFLRACAALIMPPHGQQDLKKDRLELAGRDWLVLGSDFFKRYRTDQLIDYRKRSGDREAGKTVKKKGDHVADCVVAATTPKAFTFGLYPYVPRRARTPASGKKQKGGPSET